MLKTRTISTRIAALSMASVAATAAIILSLVAWQKRSQSETLTRLLAHQSEEETAKLARDVFLICETSHQELLSRVEADLRVARHLSRPPGRR
jgi:type II secretory pathway predicted ATPase ExeA